MDQAHIRQQEIGLRDQGEEVGVLSGFGLGLVERLQQTLRTEIIPSTFMGFHGISWDFMAN